MSNAATSMPAWLAESFAVLRESLRHSMSNEELSRVSPHTRVCKYADLATARSLDEALGPGKSCIFLYETKPGYGHWCMVFLRRDGERTIAEMFDPYGLLPDDQLKLVDSDARIKLAQDEPHLTRLLFECPYDVEFNHFHLQAIQEGINTCGRHCLVRLAFREYPLERYGRMMQHAKGTLTSDDIVALALPVQEGHPSSLAQHSPGIGRGAGVIPALRYNFLRSNFSTTPLY